MDVWIEAENKKKEQFCNQNKAYTDIRDSARQGEKIRDAMDCLQQFHQCPACNNDYDVALILPCSHALCGRCVAAGEGTRSGWPCGPRQLICSVPCPRCRHPVELPCQTWSSATSCLPKHPTLKSENGSRHMGSHRPHVKEESGDRPAQTSLKYPDRFSVLPVEGAVDLQEEDMKRSVNGLCFALDPSSVPPYLCLFNSCLTLTHCGGSPPASHPPNQSRRPAGSSDSPSLPHVRADVVITRGQYYWEVDVCNSSVYRVGVISLDGCSSWWLETNGSSFSAVYDGSCEPVCTIPPKIKTLGVFLNVGGGALSFHNPLTQEHLVTLPTRFSPTGVLPALGLGQGRLRLHCGLPPPPYVFLCKDSVFRGRREPSGDWCCRDVPFQLVRRTIQKFEKLALSD